MVAPVPELGRYRRAGLTTTIPRSSPFTPGNVGLQAITDGTSNTLLAAEVCPGPGRESGAPRTRVSDCYHIDGVQPGPGPARPHRRSK